MILEFWQPAGDHEVYAPDAFTRVVGLDAPLTAANGGEHVGRCLILDIVVDPDGKGALWTVEVLEATAAACGPLTVAWPLADGSLPFLDPGDRPGRPPDMLP